MSEELNVMEEEGFDAKGTEGLEDEGVEEIMAEADAMAIAKMDAIAEEVKLDALAEEKMIEEDLKEEKERLSIKILEEEKEKQNNKEKQDLEDKLAKRIIALRLKKKEAKVEMVMWGDDDDDDDFPPTPIFGGLVRIKAMKKGYDDEIFPFSGTDPDSQVMSYSWDTDIKAWTFPFDKMIKGGTKIQGPTRDGMNRPRGVKNMRTTTENCTQYVDAGGVKFNGLNPKEGKISIPMKTYKEISRKHMIDHGMIDCFLLRDPRNPLVTRDLFRQHATMTQDCVEAECMRLLSLGDLYINQNMKWSAEYIRASLAPEILETLLQEVKLDTCGPVTFHALMRIVHNDSYESMELVKEELIALKLKDFPGENIREFNVKVADLADHLSCGEHFNEELIPKVCMKYENAADTKFSHWATIHLYNRALKQIQDLRVCDRTAISYPLLTIKEIVKLSNKQYGDAIAAGRYTTAITESAGKNGDAQLPHGYLAIIKDEITKGLKQVDFANKSGNGTGGGGTRGTGGSGQFSGNCFGCGATGVKQSDCPKCKAKNGSVNLDKIIVNGTTYKYTEFDTWQAIEPAGDQSKQIRHGTKRYRWCNECGGGNGKWCYHYGGEPHAAYITKMKERATTATSAAANLAVVADSGDNDDNAWQSTGFAGLASQL